MANATGLATSAWKRVEIKGIYTTYVYILRYKRNMFSQLLPASLNDLKAKMKTFKADYISILSLAIITLTTPTIIFLDTKDIYENIILLIFLFLICGLTSFYFLKDFSNITITDNELIVNFIFKRTRIIKNEEVTGLIYRFEQDQRTKYSWKEIRIKTKDKKDIGLRKLCFLNFFRLETELRRKYPILIPTTETMLTQEQKRDLDKEIYYFDKMTLKRDMIVSLIIGVIVTGISFVSIHDKDALFIKSIPVMVLVLYFLYNGIKNGLLTREVR